MQPVYFFPPTVRVMLSGTVTPLPPVISVDRISKIPVTCKKQAARMGSLPVCGFFPRLSQYW